MAQPNDVQQILDVRQESREERAAKRAAEMDAKDKLKRKRPGKWLKIFILVSDAENVNREVFALLGDKDPQMVPAQEKPVEDEKKKIPKLDRPVDKWVWSPFANPARQDQAQFCHWMKRKEIGEAYAFARFNRKAAVVTYTEEQYEKAVAPLKSDWSKLETDVLFDLCERFNLRFIVVADRFSYELQEKIAAKEEEEMKDCQLFADAKKNKRQQKRDRKLMTKPVYKDRSVDEIKNRYFEVAKAVLVLQGQNNHAIVQKPFNFEQEVRRKNNLEKLFMRTKDQMEREKAMQLELKKIEQKIKKEEKEERNLAKLIENDLEESKYQFSLQKSNKPGKRDGTKLYQGVMLLSNRFLTKLPVSESIQMQIDAALQGMKIDPSTLHCSKAVCDEFDNLREQMLIYFAIDKFINKKKEEQAEVKEWREEIESLLFVFDKNREYLDKNAKLLAEQALVAQDQKHPQLMRQASQQGMPTPQINGQTVNAQMLQKGPQGPPNGQQVVDPTKQLAQPQKILRAKDVKPDANATVSLNIDDKEQVASSALSERTRRKRSKNKGKNDNSEPQVEDSSLPESAQESGSQSPRTKSAQPKKANRPGRPKRPVKKPGQGSGNASGV